MATQPVFSNEGYVQPLTIRQGSDFLFSLALFAGDVTDPLDLTDVEEIRATLKQVGVEAEVNFTATKDAEIESGIIHCKLPRQVTSALVLTPEGLMAPANYNWTCDVKIAGNVLPVCRGPVKIVKGETQWL